jgi:Ran GTPase-activating protein (RanGAP) involved in mRNA processing and transport
MSHTLSRVRIHIHNTHKTNRGSDIDSDGAGLLAVTLAEGHFTRLQKLELENNDLGPEGSAHIAEALPHLSALTELSLGRTQMFDEGATHLAGTLPQCRSLRTLHLHSNFLGHGSARALADALPRCSAGLSSLNLSRNLLGVEGIRLLVSDMCV